jgi:hypothetical protein
MQARRKDPPHMISLFTTDGKCDRRSAQDALEFCKCLLQVALVRSGDGRKMGYKALMILPLCGALTPQSA